MTQLRQFQWTDYDAVVAVWAAAGREVVPRAELAGLRFWQELGYLPCPDVLCTKPLPHTSA